MESDFLVNLESEPESESQMGRNRASLLATCGSAHAHIKVKWPMVAHTGPMQGFARQALFGTKLIVVVVELGPKLIASLWGQLGGT